MRINEIRTQIVGPEQSKKVRGEISLPNTSGTPGVLVKDPVIAGSALDDALGVFAQLYSANGLSAQDEISPLRQRVEKMKLDLIGVHEKKISQEDKTRIKREAIIFLRNASDLYAESQKKSNENGTNETVIFDSSL
ncbi:MAG: hypothetical protein Q7R53_03170 [bacterium]|nr:hypothetical protein [bacterium]